MSRSLIFIFFLGFISSCSEQNGHHQNKSIEELTDTLQFQELDLELAFNDFMLFDTSYQLYEYDMCTPLHNSGYRISNTKYYNEDTLTFLYDYSNDSLLNLTISLKPKMEGIKSTHEYVRKLYDMRKTTMKAQGWEFLEPEIYEIFNSSGIEIALIGSNSPEKNGKFFSSLQVAGIVDSTIITAQLTYFGSANSNYLKTFEQIAKSVVVKNSNQTF